MKKTLLALLLITMTPIAFADDEETLRHIKEVLWNQAYRTQDVELLDRILHEDFVVITDSGEKSTKQQELDYIANNVWDPGTFRYEIERLDIYEGKFAIVAGRGIAENYSYSSSNVLIKVDGEWKAISSHVSGVKTDDE